MVRRAYRWLGVAALCAAAALSVASDGVKVDDTCAMTKSSAFRSMQPCAVCQSGNCVPSTERLVWQSQQAVARGDMKTAIAKMEAAVVRSYRLAAGEGPWAHLAELYCVQSRRETDASAAARLRRKGINLLREHRCAQRMKQTLSCALPDWRGEASTERAPDDELPVAVAPNPRPWGYVPNPDVPPMCFVTFCSVGFQNDDDGERRATTYNINAADDYHDVEADPVIAGADRRADAALVANAAKWCNAPTEAVK
jgi:hypothetical protein